MTTTSSAPSTASPEAVPAGAATSDYFRLDDDLTPEEIAVRDRVRAFAEQQVLPIINAYWEKAEFPWELLPGLAELGIIGTTIQGHGCPGMSRKAAGMVAREMARVDGSINTFLGVHGNLCMGALNMLGSEEQKDRWLPAMARLEKTGAFALTEPEHGSDSVALETTARRDGDSWVIDGHKRWIGNGHAADVVVLFARSTEDGKVNAFVVQKTAVGEHPAGYRPEVITGKVGKRAIQQADIVLEGLRVPAANRLEHCRSFKDVSPGCCRPPAAGPPGRPWGTRWPPSRSPPTTPPAASSSATRSAATSSCSPGWRTCSASSPPCSCCATGWPSSPTGGSCPTRRPRW